MVRILKGVEAVLVPRPFLIRIRSVGKVDFNPRHVGPPARMEQLCSELYGFSLNLIFAYFSKISLENRSSIKI